MRRADQWRAELGAVLRRQLRMTKVNKFGRAMLVTAVTARGSKHMATCFARFDDASDRNIEVQFTGQGIYSLDNIPRALLKRAVRWKWTSADPRHPLECLAMEFDC